MEIKVYYFIDTNDAVGFSWHKSQQLSRIFFKCICDQITVNKNVFLGIMPVILSILEKYHIKLKH